MSKWHEMTFNRGDGSVGMDGDEFLDALRWAVDAIRRIEPPSTDRAFKAVEYCIEAADSLLRARMVLEGMSDAEIAKVFAT